MIHAYKIDGHVNLGLSEHTYRHPEYKDRSSQQEENTSVQMGVAMEVVQLSKEEMGLQQVKGRCICSETEQETTYILESTHRSRHTSSRCLSSEVTKEGHLLEPTMDINSKSSAKATRRQSQGSDVDHAIVADPVLTELTHEDETTENADKNEVQMPVVASRMGVIFRKG